MSTTAPAPSPPLPLADAARAAAGLLTSTALVALAVHLAAAPEARRLLDFDFPGVPNEIGAAAGIFAHNARVLAGVLVACIAVQLRHDAGEGAPAYALRTIAAACDGALLVACALHVLLVGAAFGAYGGRVVAATAAHGPAELSAFALALGLYLAGRRGRLAPRTSIATALAAFAALALAALLEAFA